MQLSDVAVAWIFAMMYSYIGKINWDDSVMVLLFVFMINGVSLMLLCLDI